MYMSCIQRGEGLLKLLMLQKSYEGMSDSK